MPDFTLTAKHLAAVAVLAKGRPQHEAADAAGVNERTVRRWVAEHEAFRLAVTEMEAEYANTLRARTRAAAMDAADTLAQLASGVRPDGTPVPVTEQRQAAATLLRTAAQNDARTQVDVNHTGTLQYEVTGFDLSELAK